MDASASGTGKYAKLYKLKYKIRSRFGADVRNYTVETHENGIFVSYFEVFYFSYMRETIHGR